MKNKKAPEGVLEKTVLNTVITAMLDRIVDLEKENDRLKEELNLRRGVDDKSDIKYAF